MKNNRGMTSVLMLALGLALIPSPMHGAIWSEGGDAGDLIGSAQTVTGSFELNGISGSLSGQIDRDIYQIRITDPNNFGFNVTFTSGNTDTILALFNSIGVGVVYNDNITTTDFRSRLDYTSGFLDSPGDYYLAIMGGGQTFISDTGNIWNETEPFDVQKDPDGGGLADPLIGYAGAGQLPIVGNYTITVSGGVTPVPEPAFYGVAFAVMGLAVAGIRSISARKRNSKLAVAA
jgi:hypothetical protein